MEKLGPRKRHGRVACRPTGWSGHPDEIHGRPVCPFLSSRLLDETPAPFSSRSFATHSSTWTLVSSQSMDVRSTSCLFARDRFSTRSLDGAILQRSSNHRFRLDLLPDRLLGLDEARLDVPSSPGSSRLNISRSCLVQLEPGARLVPSKKTDDASRSGPLFYALHLAGSVYSANVLDRSPLIDSPILLVGR